MSLTNRSQYLLNTSNAPTNNDLRNILYDIQGINYLIASATFTFTQVNDCNVTPLTIAAPSAPNKTMLPIAFYYSQALSGGDAFGVGFVITMSAAGNLTATLAAGNGADFYIELPKAIPTDMYSTILEAGETFKLSSDGAGGGTAGTVTITTIYVEI